MRWIGGLRAALRALRPLESDLRRPRSPRDAGEREQGRTRSSRCDVSARIHHRAYRMSATWTSIRTPSAASGKRMRRRRLAGHAAPLRPQASLAAVSLALVGATPALAQTATHEVQRMPSQNGTVIRSATASNGVARAFAREGSSRRDVRLQKGGANRGTGASAPLLGLAHAARSDRQTVLLRRQVGRDSGLLRSGPHGIDTAFSGATPSSSASARKRSERHATASWCERILIVVLLGLTGWCRMETTGRPVKDRTSARPRALPSFAENAMSASVPRANSSWSMSPSFRRVSTVRRPRRPSSYGSRKGASRTPWPRAASRLTPTRADEALNPRRRVATSCRAGSC